MHLSREHQAVYEEIGSCNDHSHEQPSNAPITERDEMRNQRGIDDQEMESILTRRMESIDRTLSPLKVTLLI